MKFWVNSMKRIVDFIICLVSGPIGLHRFLKGESFYGLLYIISIGVFLYGGFSGGESKLPIWAMLATALFWLMDLVFILIKGRHFFFTQGEIDHYSSLVEGVVSDNQPEPSDDSNDQFVISLLSGVAENLDAIEEPKVNDFASISAELNDILPRHLEKISEDTEATELVARINDYLSIVDEFKELEHFGALMDAIEASDTEIRDILGTIAEDEGYDDIEEYLDDNYESVELAQKFIIGTAIWSITDYAERLNDFK